MLTPRLPPQPTAPVVAPPVAPLVNGGRSGHCLQMMMLASDAAEDVPDVAGDTPGDREMEPVVEDAFLAEVERALFTSSAERLSLRRIVRP